MLLSQFPARLVACSVAAALGVSACATTPPSTMLAMSSMRPLDADPAAIRLAVELPEVLRVRDGDIKLRVGFDGPTPETRLVEEYAAIVTDDANGLPGLDNEFDDGMYIAVAALSEEDAEALARTQKRIKSWRTVGIDGKGTLTVSASACADGPVPDGPLYVTTFLQTEPGKPFMTLSRRTDLRDALATIAADGMTQGAVGQCTEPSGA